MERHYDRTAEDIGNVVALEHVNVTIPDQQIATVFYVTGLGFTRDPYIMTGTNNMWINIGRSQFHLPTNKPQVLRGHVGLVVPSREALLRRLAGVRKALEGTRFDFREHNSYVEVIQPWGNELRCYEPQEQFGRVTLGIPYVEFDVPQGSADGIARFYRDIVDTPARVAEDGQGRAAHVFAGQNQELVYRETDRPIPGYDGHHFQIYVSDFSGLHGRLVERDLVFEESDQWQYRFKDIVDLDTGKPLFTVEHEIRSITHPLFARPLVNRNPEQTNTHYARGHDALVWQMPHAH
jgi:hypothetical protein